MSHIHEFSPPMDVRPIISENGARPIADKLSKLETSRCACGCGRVRARAKPGAGLSDAQRQRALRLAIESS